MSSRDWFSDALAAESRALNAKTAAERKRHGQDAIDALMAAASLGSHEAFFQLGIHYQHGAYGVLRARLDLAEHWLRLAARQDPGGMFALGTLLMSTDRRAEGRRWLQRALDHGEGGAACHLGREFEDKSPSRALRLYLKGAALGDPFAAFCAASVLEKRESRAALLQAEALYAKAMPKIEGADEALERVRRKLKAMTPRHDGAVGKRHR